MDLKDNYLIANYLKGDNGALKIIIGRYLKPVYVFVYRYTRNQNDAEDITQEVFVKVWKNLKKFDRKKNFKAWIFAIARNSAIDFLRKKKDVPFSVFDAEDGGNIITDTAIDLLPLPQEIFERKEISEEINSAIDGLPLKYRVIMFLHHIDDFKFEEIAEITKEPLNTLKSRYRRALIILKEKLSHL